MKYLLLILTINLAIACNAKTSNSDATSAAPANKTIDTKPKNDHAITEVKAELKSTVAEKAEMADKTMQDAKESIKTKAEVVSDKKQEVETMKEKVVAAPSKVKESMAEKHDMSETEMKKGKEKMDESVASTKEVIAKAAPTATSVAKEEAVAVKEEAMAKKDEMVEKAKPVLAVDHSGFDKLLKKYVSSSGVVNYAGLKGSRSELNAYLDIVSKKVPDSSWGRNESLAYWINVYNAYTLDLILTNYPTSSITNLDGGKPWDVKRITLAGKKYSLNDIEHTIIRPQFNDARIHFAVNCAAKSCPKLNNGAMTAANVNGTLESLTKQFVNNSAINTISSNSASLSKIFEWYASDFGDLVTFINKYSSQAMQSGASISYVDYDWALNGK